jgi:hypothetical protein
MAKVRKTLQQKKLADLHRHLTFDKEIKIPLSTGHSFVKRQDSSILLYPNVLEDLRKTAIVTFAIIFFQVILFLIFKNHIATVFGLTF